MKQKSPDFNMRIGERKQSWLTAMRKDGFLKLATWVKWVIESHIRKGDDEH